jgi:nucleoside-diphosphate-sugar epimerase
VNDHVRPSAPAEPGFPTPTWERFGQLVTPGQRIIITGASGFIGTNVLEFYHRCGCEVINIDFAPPRNPDHQRFWKPIDIRQFEPYNATVRDFQPDLFLHLAARTDLDEKKDLQGYGANMVGVEHTLRAVEGLKNLKRLIVTSSQLVCRPGYVPKTMDDYAPHTLYGESKVQTELITRAWKNAPCPWTLVRPTSIWGPWFDIPYKTFFLAVAERKYMHQHGVNPVRSFGFVGNGVFEYVKLTLAPEEEIDRQTLYLSNTDPIKVREWADMIQQEMGVPHVREVPLSLLIAAAKIGDAAQHLGWKNPPLTSFRLKNLTGDNVADMEPVKRIIGPMPYSVEEGVKVTVDWMRREGWIPWEKRVPMIDPPLPRVYPFHVRLQTGLPEGT